MLQEPSVQEYYEFLRDYKEVPLKEFDKSKGPPITRLTNVDDATFQQYVRDGVPFVVDDCTRGFDEDAVSNFECKKFADRWPTGNMRAEYTPGQYHIHLKDPNWYTKIYPQRAHKEHMAGGTKIAGPYIWHVKDEEPLKTKREVQQHWRTPYFLERSPTNNMEANESFEFWFSHAGGGTFTHADAYCESTISMQFKGNKRWRIQAFPKINHFFNATAFGDETIYDAKTHVAWTPETEFTVGPGQCFVFPTGYLHETFVDPVGNDDGCYTAATFQFNHPRQVNLYRAYLSRFSMSHYGMTEPCLNNHEHYATLFGRGRIKGKVDKAAADAKAAEIMEAVDGNRDGRITVDEMSKHFWGTKAARKRAMEVGQFHYNWYKLLNAQQKQDMENEAMAVWSEDALQYHDINRDKAVTVEELGHSLLQWHVVKNRKETVKTASTKIRKPDKWLEKVLASEKDAIEKHYCKDAANCPELDAISEYGKSLAANKKKLSRAQDNVAGMMEGEGGDDEQLNFKDRETGQEERKGVREVRKEL